MQLDHVYLQESRVCRTPEAQEGSHEMEKEIIWMSERDGWNNLYLYDGATGAVKSQITKCKNQIPILGPGTYIT